MHRSLQLNTEKLQIKRNAQAAHLLIGTSEKFTPLNEVRAAKLSRKAEGSEEKIASRGRKVKRQARLP